MSVTRNTTAVLQDAELHLEAGQMVWLGAPSGSGKTTLLLALARLLPLDRGELALDGVAAAQIPAPEWRSRVLLAPHPALALGGTLEDDLLAPHRLRQRRRGPMPGPDVLREELDALGLDDLGLDYPPRRLSQGQLGRVALARALLARPSVLLLDEPTANLDAGARSRVERRVAEYCENGGAVVVAGHGSPWEIPTGSASVPPMAASGTPR